MLGGSLCDSAVLREALSSRAERRTVLQSERRIEGLPIGSSSDRTRRFPRYWSLTNRRDSKDIPLLGYIFCLSFYPALLMMFATANLIRHCDHQNTLPPRRSIRPEPARFHVPSGSSALGLRHSPPHILWRSIDETSYTPDRSWCGVVAGASV